MWILTAVPFSIRSRNLEKNKHVLPREFSQMIVVRTGVYKTDVVGALCAAAAARFCI